MNFQFSSDLDYQRDAISAVVDLFDTGKNAEQGEKLFELTSSIAVVPNILELDTDRILKQLKHIQKKNNITPVSDQINTHDYTIEMETGTGKTYVYLRTIMELYQKYRVTKYIILVPSVAIREGVLKTIEQTRKHFHELYGVWYGAFAYDSSKLSQVKEFVSSMDPQIMIMTIQSFKTDTAVMRQTPDRFQGESPLSLIAQCRPVVIMDEPQNMESDLSRMAIADLQPLIKLRYSATHRELHNLVYRLTPVDALRKGLVKKIQVWGVHSDDPNEVKLQLQEFIVEKNKLPRARVTLEVKNSAGEYLEKDMILSVGDGLKIKTKNEKYTDLTVNEINAAEEFIELSDGKKYIVGGDNINKEAIFRTQIHETIRAHVRRQKLVGDKLKVLSLFFIDHVDNYIHLDSLIRRLFEEEYVAEFKVPANRVHTGYFAKKKLKGIDVAIDTRGDSKADKDVYDLIMKDKERLLSFEEPVAFIFTHSALKEGWDNPNIFQICTLRDTESLMKKRQEIGRGMRLPVTVDGDRVHDSNIATLTVIANDSYRSYVSKLQGEYTEAGYGAIPTPEDAKEARVTVKTTKYLADANFIELWNRVAKRTRFSIELDTTTLVQTCITKINDLSVRKLVVNIERVDLYIDKIGRFQTTTLSAGEGSKLSRSQVKLVDLISRICLETNITKSTTLSILSRVTNIDLLLINPEEYTRSCIKIIQAVKQDMLINDGLRYIPTGGIWEARLLYEEYEALEKKSIHASKSPLTHIVFDSEGEKEFAQGLENNSNVKVYTKLPRGFSIDTPLGGYTPDWAIVWHADDGDRLYLVRETKFGYSNMEADLSNEEKVKIICGHKHFESIGVNFRTVEKHDLGDLV